MAKIFLIIISLIGWFALVLQFILMLTGAETQSLSIAERIVRFFSFFTIQSNLIVALTATMTSFFPNGRLGRFFTDPRTQTAVAVYILIVGLIYSIFLRSVWSPVGWQAVADHLLHDVIPVLYLVYWFAFVEKSDLEWRDPVKWLVFPLLYIVYSTGRGAFVGWYPYYFADVGLLGYPRALLNGFFVLIAFVIVGSGLVAIGKFTFRPAKKAQN